jgi:hypothetical protein
LVANNVVDPDRWQSTVSEFCLNSSEFKRHSPLAGSGFATRIGSPQTQGASSGAAQIQAVLNWPEELKARVSSK